MKIFLVKRIIKWSCIMQVRIRKEKNSKIYSEISAPKNISVFSVQHLPCPTFTSSCFYCTFECYHKPTTYGFDPCFPTVTPPANSPSPVANLTDRDSFGLDTGGEATIAIIAALMILSTAVFALWCARKRRRKIIPR